MFRCFPGAPSIAGLAVLIRWHFSSCSSARAKCRNAGPFAPWRRKLVSVLLVWEFVILYVYSWMLSALLPTPGFAQNWTLPVSELKHVCSLVFVRFRLQTSASNSEQIDVGQMSQKIHAPVAMDLQQNRSTDRNCPFSFQPYFAPTPQITFSTKYLKRIPTLCFANKLANFCRCLMFFCRACSMDKSSSSTFRGNASSSALRGGVAAVLVQTACVPTFMWMFLVPQWRGSWLSFRFWTQVGISCKVLL